MKKFLFCIFIFPLIAKGQVVISSGTQLQASQDTPVLIQTPNNISNNSATADLSKAKLTFDLIGGTQSITGNFNLVSLLISAGGVKTINNTISVTDNIAFTQGIVSPSGSGKLLYTGADDGLTGGNASSYYDGIFYSSGSGPRTFPIGTAGIFSPVTFESVSGETGVRIRAENAALTADGVEITAVDQDRYWEITTDPSLVNSKVTLSVNGLDAFTSTDGSTTIVQATTTSVQAVNLGNSSSSNASAIVSRSNVTAAILTVGKEKHIIVKVHDLITPFGSNGVNDQLFIENIEKFDHNKVTLLDRWGVLVREWKNFTNEDPFDYSKLGPGNYICVVEYGNENSSTNSIEQMVTVLKTN